MEMISFTSFPSDLIIALMILQRNESKTSDFVSAAYIQNSLSQIQTSVDIEGELQYLISEQLKQIN
jgi:hypothetical protein